MKRLSYPLQLCPNWRLRHRVFRVYLNFGKLHQAAGKLLCLFLGLYFSESASLGPGGPQPLRSVHCQWRRQFRGRASKHLLDTLLTLS